MISISSARTSNFYPRPPRGGRRIGCFIPLHAERFLSTPSARRATATRPAMPLHLQISIHALREEGDGSGERAAGALRYFYPRPPRGGRRGCAHGLPLRKNFYPRPPRGGRRMTARATIDRLMDFYPRPPRGGRLFAVRRHLRPLRFLSTPSARRATRSTRSPRRSHGNFYPRPPRGGRPCAAGAVSTTRIFLSTPSARRATTRRRPDKRRRPNFYPRPPRGGRPRRPCGRS